MMQVMILPRRLQALDEFLREIFHHVFLMLDHSKYAFSFLRTVNFGAQRYTLGLYHNDLLLSDADPSSS